MRIDKIKIYRNRNVKDVNIKIILKIEDLHI